MPPCVVAVRVVYGGRTDVNAERCIDPLDDASLTTPWGRTVRAPSAVPDDEGRAAIRFVADPRNTPIDPLDRRTWKLGEPWRIRQPLLATGLTPSEEQPRSPTRRRPPGVDAATAPSLRRPSSPSTRSTPPTRDPPAPSILELTVAHGGGPPTGLSPPSARSCPVLTACAVVRPHDPGTHRRTRVELPANVDESTVMLVLVFHEANGFAPVISRRFPSASSPPPRGSPSPARPRPARWWSTPASLVRSLHVSNEGAASRRSAPPPPSRPQVAASHRHRIARQEISSCRCASWRAAPSISSWPSTWSLPRPPRARLDLAVGHHPPPAAVSVVDRAEYRTAR
jgi:hypothetical protein